jgi:thiol-disulfide isomerase/thioredoxin
MDKKTWFYIALFILIVAGLFGWYAFAPGQYDGLAQCIKDSGATFYGAFWCPHCQEQKAEFGKSVKFLPYVECSTPDGQGQLEVCKEKGIQGYPTWVFKNGNRQSSVMSLEDLAATTSCPFKK